MPPLQGSLPCLARMRPRSQAAKDWANTIQTGYPDVFCCLNGTAPHCLSASVHLVADVPSTPTFCIHRHSSDKTSYYRWPSVSGCSCQSLEQNLVDVTASQLLTGKLYFVILTLPFPNIKLLGISTLSINININRCEWSFLEVSKY